MQRVDAQAEIEMGALRFGGFDERLEALPLRQCVEHDVVGDLQHFLQVTRGVRGGIDMHFLAVLFTTEFCFKQAARTGTGQVAHDQRAEAEHGEGLQREQHLRTGFLLHAVQDAQVAFDRRFVDDETG